MKGYEFHREARAEYLKAIRYHRSISPELTERFQKDFELTLNLIRRHPEIGAVVGKHGVHRILLRRFKYAIRYPSREDTIVIVALFPLHCPAVHIQLLYRYSYLPEPLRRTTFRLHRICQHQQVLGGNSDRLMLYSREQPYGSRLVHRECSQNSGTFLLVMMAMTVEQLEQEAVRLSEGERIELISRLSTGLGTGMSPEVESAWEKELRHRMADLDSGRGKTRNVDEVLAELLAESHAAD